MQLSGLTNKYFWCYKLYLINCLSYINVPVLEQLFTLPEHMSSPLVFSGVHVTRSLVLCVCFVDRCLSFCTFSFSHCVVCLSSIYRIVLPLWYLQTLLREYRRGNLNGQYRETDNMRYKRRRQTKQYVLDTTIDKQTQMT